MLGPTDETHLDRGGDVYEIFNVPMCIGCFDFDRDEDTISVAS